MPRLSCAVALALLVAAPGAGSARVWKRTRPDGTQEFTNVPPPGRNWNVMPGLGRQPGAAATGDARPVPAAAQTRASGGGAMWTRQHSDGTVEFTNLAPTGARWKVLFKTGPGKAAATRGLSDLVPARDTSPARFSRFDLHIRDQQAFYGIPRALIRAVIKTESDFDPRVVSSAGAVGLMQLLPGTAREMGVTDILDPRQNIMGGARYLQILAKRFCRTPAGSGGTGLVCSLDEKIRVLAGYHAGPGAVEKYDGMPPYETTRSYVMTVLGRYEQYRKRDALDAGSLVAAQ